MGLVFIARVHGNNRRKKECTGTRPPYYRRHCVLCISHSQYIYFSYSLCYHLLHCSRTYIPIGSLNTFKFDIQFCLFNAKIGNNFFCVFKFGFLCLFRCVCACVAVCSVRIKFKFCEQKAMLCANHCVFIY